MVVRQAQHHVEVDGLVRREPEAVVEQRGTDRDGGGQLTGGDDRAEHPLVGDDACVEGLRDRTAGHHRPDLARQGPEVGGELAPILGHHVERNDGVGPLRLGEDAGGWTPWNPGAATASATPPSPINQSGDDSQTTLDSLTGANQCGTATPVLTNTAGQPEQGAAAMAPASRSW
jgi:hypothetical protein